ncbi:MAG: OadG family protein [Anaerolineae bacterium]|nr:OadG family protein [Anaerolineae bacterium]
MTNIWSQAFTITVVGIALVFSTLLLLWGIMAALTRLLRVRAAPHGAKVTALVSPAEESEDHNAKIAAIMVALDLYQTEMRREAAPPVREHRPGSLPSRWVAIGRGRQVEGRELHRRSSGH